MKIRRLKSRSSTGWCRWKQKPPFGPFGSFYTNAASILIGFILSHQQRPREAESLRTAAMEAVCFGLADVTYTVSIHFFSSFQCGQNGCNSSKYCGSFQNFRTRDIDNVIISKTLRSSNDGYFRRLYMSRWSSRNNWFWVVVHELLSRFVSDCIEDRYNELEK